MCVLGWWSVCWGLEGFVVCDGDYCIGYVGGFGGGEVDVCVCEFSWLVCVV